MENTPRSRSVSIGTSSCRVNRRFPAATGYAGATRTTCALLRWWFDTEHLTEGADGTLTPFRYYFAQREAVETVLWLHDVRQVRDKFDLMRFASSGAVSAGMFDETWPR
jgi:type III restriction enzyme